MYPNKKTAEYLEQENIAVNGYISVGINIPCLQSCLDVSKYLL